jgi:uncharacterized protein YjbI with pentapeptide repeats
MKYVQDQEFSGLDIAWKRFELAEYEGCVFSNCVFVETDFTACEFVECHFLDCDLSNAIIKKTAFKVVSFINCKLLGLKFNLTNPFLREFRFTNCVLNYSSFYQMPLKGLQLNGCQLREVDFVEADLSGSTFANCDLAGALFENTVLSKADLSTARNIELDPDENQVRGLKVSQENLSGLLTKYQLNIKP